MTISPETLTKLGEYDTPTICNLIELFDFRPRNTGYMDGSIVADFPDLPPMVGFAATCCFRSDAPPVGGDAYGDIADQLEQFAALPGPAVVTIQDIDCPAVSAVFGEVMCSTYQGFGAAGLVTNGGGRDLEQVGEIDFPVFTGTTIASHGYCHLLHLGLPVRVGSLVVTQGDLLHGDANGVTNVPIELADQIVDVADEFIAAEMLMVDYVRSDEEKTVARFTELRKEFQERVKKIRQRLA
ncbi:MAG: RraA family protein [bacterium]|nr:RraA family protein [bacterium]